MRIQFDVDSASVKDVRLLASIADEMVRELTNEIEQCEPIAAVAERAKLVNEAIAAETAAPTSEPEEKPAEQPAKRTRRTKAEMEAARAEEKTARLASSYREGTSGLVAALTAPEAKIEQPAVAPAEQPASVAATQIPPASEQPAAPISVDDLRSALQALTSVKGMQVGIELLKKFGCSRVSELAAKDEATKRAFLNEAK